MKKIKSAIGGSGWGNFKKGKRITKISDVKIGDILLTYNKQFNSKNIIRVEKTPENWAVTYNPSELFRAVFVDPKDTSKKRMPEDSLFTVWNWELKQDEFWTIKKPANGKIRTQDVKRIHITAKCSDLCYTELQDKDGKALANHDGYVPDFMPGEHWGDYVILDIDIETGTILNWKRPTKKDIEKPNNRDEWKPIED